VPAHLATKFQECFSPGVIRVDPRTKKVSADEKNMRRDTVSREVLRHPEFEGCVELKRVRDFFLCELNFFSNCDFDLMDDMVVNIESESFYPPERLLPEAIKVMRGKIATIRKAAEALLADSDALDEEIEGGAAAGMGIPREVAGEGDIIMVEA
jgi:DNA-directed RNA polymerases I and III subunit RPAC1